MCVILSLIHLLCLHLSGPGCVLGTELGSVGAETRREALQLPLGAYTH